MALIDEVNKVCDRIAPHGWAALLQHHGLDITAADLATELAKNLTGIRRSLRGFEDFAHEGVRGIEPGHPARSLLFHALASSNVLTSVDGSPLGTFPTLAEIDAVENYVYGVAPPSLPELLARTHNAPVAIAVFAAEYRPSVETVHQKHADMCFARTGVARVGTAEPHYDPPRRGFLPFVQDNPHAFRVLPARYAAYVSVEMSGNKASSIPMRFKEPNAQAQEKGDQTRLFWVPIHKLFSGSECIRGLDLHVTVEAHHVNEKLRRIHIALGANASWHEPEISSPPFRFTDGIAAWSNNPDFGPGTLVPIVHPALVEPADFQGKPLTFLVPQNVPLSSSFNIPAEEGRWRHGPEYVHARHQILPNGQQVDLNDQPDVEVVVAAGGYRARHYLDFTGDGWIDPVIPELAVAIPRRRPAYSLVTAPDFFFACDQRELTEWAAHRVPSALRRTIWVIPPDGLSDQRFPANLELREAGFRSDDDTITAIVSLPITGPLQPTRLDVPETDRHSHLPDDAAGVFAPGWDVGLDGQPNSPEHLAAYGLGSPFPEDSKLCAALSTFWPAVAPDATRTFEPSQIWPTVSPLTDEEIGQVGNLPWDDVPGPQLRGQSVVEYFNLAHVDYVENALQNRFSLVLTSQIDDHDYEARVLAMTRVYKALGVDLSRPFAQVRQAKARWTVLSFRQVAPTDPELQQAQTQAGVSLQISIYRFQVYRHGNTMPDPNNFRKSLVTIQQPVTLFVDPVRILMKQGAGTWKPVNG